jgi:hypothetical protein
MPFPLLVVGAWAFARLANHYDWNGGTRLLIGLLFLALFVLIVGPVTLLPDLRRKREESLEASERMAEALKREARQRQAPGVSTREGAQFRTPPS